MPNPAPGFDKHPGYQVNITPLASKLTVRVGDVIIAESDRAVVVEETRHRPVWYMPLDDVNSAYTQATETETYCPFKGYANYWSVVIADTTSADAIWAYMSPYDECATLTGYASFYTNKVDLLINGDLMNKDGPGWIES